VLYIFKCKKVVECEDFSKLCSVCLPIHSVIVLKAKKYVMKFDDAGCWMTILHQ